MRPGTGGRYCLALCVIAITILILPHKLNAAGNRADSARAEPLRAAIARHAALNGVPVPLAMGVVHLESRFNPLASNGPYAGLMQIHPRTAASLGYRGQRSGLMGSEINLTYGMKYLGQAHRLANGNTCGTIMRYQSGLRATRMNGANRSYCARLTAYINGR